MTAAPDPVAPRVESGQALHVQRETFEQLEPEWNTLLTGACAAAPFLTPTWLKVWWENFGQGREQLLLSFREDGRLKGIAPLMRSGETLSFLALTDICDYHDFLFPCGGEEPYFRALLDEVCRLPWAELRLEGLREGCAALALLPKLLPQYGLSAEVLPDEVSPHIPVTPTWDAYLESLNKKDRHELRRKLRRLESAGQVRLTTASSATLAADVAQFLELMKDSREEKAAFMTTERERFFHRLAKAMDAGGMFRLFFLELDGKRMAGAFCFDYGDKYFLYNSGFDTTQAHLSVGLLLKALLLKDAIERGKKDYDLLRGAEPYKYHLGAQDRWLHKMVVRRTDKGY